jgi:hypothetical protein
MQEDHEGPLPALVPAVLFGQIEKIIRLQYLRDALFQFLRLLLARGGILGADRTGKSITAPSTATTVIRDL